MFTNLYNTQDLRNISNRIDKEFPKDAGGGNNINRSTNYDLQEDIATLGTQIAFQERIIANLLKRVNQLEASLPLIGI